MIILSKKLQIQDLYIYKLQYFLLFYKYKKFEL